MFLFGTSLTGKLFSQYVVPFLATTQYLKIFYTILKLKIFDQNSDFVEFYAKFYSYKLN